MTGKFFKIVCFLSFALVIQNCGPKENLVTNEESSVSDQSISKSSFTNTDEFKRHIINEELTEFYRIYLYREPDQAGLQFWSNHVYQGNITMKEAKRYIKTSPEAQDVETPAEYQFIPSADRPEFTCEYRQPNGQTTTLSSRVGYITQFVIRAGSSYPKKARYKNSYGHYCMKQRVRCWADQIRARTMKIKLVASRFSTCNESTFRNNNETDYNYIKAVNEQLADVYEYCEDRAPTRDEIDVAITDIVENGGAVYDVAASLCNL